MTAAPDLRTYHWTHRAMRASGDTLHAALSDLDGPDRRRAAALRWWYEGIKGEVLAHHLVEDELFFPALAERVPAFAAHGGDLAADHEHLDVVLDRLSRAIDDLGTSPHWDAARDRARDLAAELASHLHRHLAVEDDEILPLFLDHLTAEEYEALDAQAMKRIGFSQLRFTVPWFVSHLTGDERAVVLDEAPLPMVLLWRATRSRYARRAAEALGTRVPVVL